MGIITRSGLLLIVAAGIAGCNKSSDTTVSNSTPAPATMPSVAGSDLNAPATRPDNTAINTRDRAPDTQTAGMQGESKSDIDLTAEIRRRILMQSMSVNAQNAKIVAINGKITLRGPVSNQGEKDSIGQIANTVAGAGNVDNQLDVQQQ